MHWKCMKLPVSNRKRIPDQSHCYHIHSNDKYLFHLCCKFRRANAVDCRDFCDLSSRAPWWCRLFDCKTCRAYFGGWSSRQYRTVQWKMFAVHLWPLCIRAVWLRPNSQSSSPATRALHCLLSNGPTMFCQRLVFETGRKINNTQMC